MELGNLVFGCSRGQYPLERTAGFEEQFERLQDKLEMNYHCEEFDNDTFTILPYHWGECTCGFDLEEYQEKHRNDCYQIELRSEKLSAGASINEYGFPEFPDSWSYEMKRRIKDEIYVKLTSKYNLHLEGCAAHCTCDYEDRYLLWLKQVGYPNGHRDDCLLVKPNFHFKPADFQIKWYKYPFRDAYTNQEISLAGFSTIIDTCLTSLKGDKRFINRIRGLRISSTYWQKKNEQYNKEGYLCHKCMWGIPLKGKKVICDMIERNWQSSGNIATLMLPDGTEIVWKKECEHFRDNEQE